MVNRIGHRINWGDYLRDTKHLTATTHGAYLLLLGHYWTHGGLPADDRALARIAALRFDQWIRHRETLRAFFKIDPVSGKWAHKRVDRDLAALEKYLKSKADAAVARWQQPVENRPSEGGLSTHAFAEPVRGRKSLNSHGATHADAMQDLSKNKKKKNARARVGVDKASPPAPGPRSSSRARFRARQAVEHDLLKALGADHYATAIDLLADNPRILERATNDELQQPGRGILAALEWLRALPPTRARR